MDRNVVLAGLRKGESEDETLPRQQFMAQALQQEMRSLRLEDGGRMRVEFDRIDQFQLFPLPAHYGCYHLGCGRERRRRSDQRIGRLAAHGERHIDESSMSPVFAHPTPAAVG